MTPKAQGSQDIEQDSPMLLDFINTALLETESAAYVQVAQIDQNIRGQVVLEVCQGVETQNSPAFTIFSPAGGIRLYWDNHPKQVVGTGDLTHAKVTILENPKYGVLKDLQEIDRDMGPTYSYQVNKGVPDGTEDRAVFLVKIGARSIKVVEKLIMTFNYESLGGCDGEAYYIRRVSQVIEKNSLSPNELLQLGAVRAQRQVE